MSNAKRRTGLNPLAYLGVDPISPPQLFVKSRAPTAADIRAYNIGCWWVVAAPTRHLYMLVGKDAGTADWIQIYPAGGGASGASNFQTDAGVAIQVAGNLDIRGGLNINTGGVGKVVTINLNDNINLAGTIITGGSITSGAALVAATSVHANTTVYGGTTVSAGQSVAAATYVEAGTGVNVLTGDVDITSGNVLLPLTNATGSAGVVTIGGNEVLHTTTVNTNICVGIQSGNFSISGSKNSLFGYRAGRLITSGYSNTINGYLSGSALTTGHENTVVGNQSFYNTSTGSGNTVIGASAGNSLGAASNTNIVIGSPGSVGDSNKIRIGTTGTHTSAHVAGTSGKFDPITSTAVPLFLDSSTEQLGSLSGLQRKVIDFGALPNAGVKSVAHGIAITATLKFFRIYGVTTDPNPGGSATFWALPIPHVSVGTPNQNIEIFIQDANILITTGIDRTQCLNTYIILEYWP